MGQMTSNTPWLDELVRHIGEREIKGPKHNPLIVSWGKAAGITWWNNDEDAWCAVAVNGVLAKVGIAGTVSALARSFVTWGIELDKPVRGAIVVFPRPPKSWTGHVEIVEKVHGATMTCVGGNVSNQVKRSTRRVADILPHGIRWPSDVPLPANVSSPMKLGGRLLEKGVAGPDVLEWQQRLGELGYGPFKGTSYFGTLTDAETRRFQRDKGLEPVDGMVGPDTLRASVKALADRKAGKGAPPPVPAPKPVPKPPGSIPELLTGAAGGGTVVEGARSGNWWVVGLGAAVIVATLAIYLIRRRR